MTRGRKPRPLAPLRAHPPETPAPTSTDLETLATERRERLRTLAVAVDGEAPGERAHNIGEVCREALELLVPIAWHLPHSISAPLADYGSHPKSPRRRVALFRALTGIAASENARGYRIEPLPLGLDGRGCAFRGHEAPAPVSAVVSWVRRHGKSSVRVRRHVCAAHAQAFAVAHRIKGSVVGAPSAGGLLEGPP